MICVQFSVVLKMLIHNTIYTHVIYTNQLTVLSIKLPEAKFISLSCLVCERPSYLKVGLVGEDLDYLSPKGKVVSLLSDD